MAQGTTRGIPIDTDPLLAADSDLLVPSQKAVKSYIDNTSIKSINSLTGAAQTIVAGTSGTDFAVSSVGTTHTFNLPTASATNRGALSTTDWNTFNGKQASLSGTGIVKSTGGTISYLTDNSTNWNTAYNRSLLSAAVTGTTTKTLTLNQQDGGTITASWTDINTDAVISYFNTGNSTLSDSTTYMLGQMTGLANNAITLAYIPLPAGTITEAYIQVFNAGTLGSAENITVNFLSNGGLTSNVLSSTVTANLRHNLVMVTGLSIPIVAGMTFITIDTPVFATNPTAVQFRISIKLKL
jgi:hypothetical protein